MEIAFSDHALFEMLKRGISRESVIAIAENPAMNQPSRHGRIILQGKYFDCNLNKEMVLRVIGIKEQVAFKVITVYKTSKFDKYWKEGSK